jgi:septin family protein
VVNAIKENNMDMINSKVTFKIDVTELNTCLDTEAEKLEAEIGDIEGFGEICDYSQDDLEVSLEVSFCNELDVASQPHGSHPYYCASDCGYCDAMDSWQEHFEEKEQELREELEEQFSALENYTFSELEFDDA